MRQLIYQEKGAISLYILVVLLVGCIVVPVYAVFLEKSAAQNSIDKIQDTVTISVTSAYMALMPEFYTDAVIKLDELVFREKFNRLLMDNLRSEFPGIDILEEQVFCDGFPRVCMRGKTFDRAGIHIVVTVPVRYSAVRLLLPIKIGELERIVVHGDVLFTLDN